MEWCKLKLYDQTDKMLHQRVTKLLSCFIGDSGQLLQSEKKIYFGCSLQSLGCWVDSMSTLALKTLKLRHSRGKGVSEWVHHCTSGLNKIVSECASRGHRYLLWSVCNDSSYKKNPLDILDNCSYFILLIKEVAFRGTHTITQTISEYCVWHWEYSEIQKLISGLKAQEEQHSILFSDSCYVCILLTVNS